MVLHNICELYDDHCIQEWIVNETCTCPTNPLPTFSATGSRNNSATERIRDAIKDHVNKCNSELAILSCVIYIYIYIYILETYYNKQNSNYKYTCISIVKQPPACMK